MSAWKKLISKPPAAADGYDIFKAYLDDPNGASLDDTAALGSVSVGAKESSPYGIYVSPDGYKLYVTGSGSDDVHEYDLSRRFDTSSATFVQSKAVNPTANNPRGLFFKDDGTKMYVTSDDNSTDNIHEFALSTAWDVSTASYNDALNIGSDVLFIRGIHFKPDGTELYVSELGNKVHQYTLSTAWDVSTGTLTGSYTHSVDSQLHDVALTSDGLTMLTVAADDDDVFKFTLSTAWDVTSATYDNENLTMGNEATATMLHISADDQYIYYGGHTNDAVITAAWRGFSVRSQESLPYGISFKPDGTKLFVSGQLEDGINAWDLSTPFDLTTATFDQGSGVINTSIQAHAWKPDGTRIFYSTTGYVREADLSTAWDVTTITQVGSFNFEEYGTDCRGISFKPDGTEIYISEEDSNKVIQYSLSTAWDISARTLVGTITVSADPAGHLWNPDGTRFIVSVDDGVRIYDLSTAWDITTATENADSVYRLLVGNNDGDLAWNDDGTKMFFLFGGTDKIYTYTIGDYP